MKTYMRPLFLFCGASTAQSMLGVLSQRINSSGINLAHGFLYKRSLYTHTHTLEHIHTCSLPSSWSAALPCHISTGRITERKELKRDRGQTIVLSSQHAPVPTDLVLPPSSTHLSCFLSLHQPISLLPPLHCSHMFWFLPIGAANKIMVDTML